MFKDKNENPSPLSSPNLTTNTTFTTNNYDTTNHDSFLQSLPTSGNFKKYSVKKPISSQIIPKYVPAHNTNPPNDEFVKNEENNILIRSLINNSVNKRINEQHNSKYKKNGDDNLYQDDSGSFTSEIENLSPNKKHKS